jgi:mono/diheme cytochrome c family protein
MAFFNPQFIPQTIARTGGALLLSALYVYLHASLVIKDGRLRDRVASRSARPALLGAIAVTLGGIGWYLFLPQSAQAALESAPALNVLAALIFALTVAVFVLLYLGPYRNPGWLSPGFAGALFLFGIAAFSAGEFIREAVRKPYVVYGCVLGNQIHPDELLRLKQVGYLEGGTWTKALVAANYPQTLVEDDGDQKRGRGRIDGQRLLALPGTDRIALGRVLFLYHCNDCHAIRHGYSAVRPLLQARSREMIVSLIHDLHEANMYMPPWSGTPEEAELLADYLDALPRPRLGGIFPELQEPERN